MDISNKMPAVVADACEVCKVRARAYTCPRCGILYCSVNCYKSERHIDCSESFYKQCVEDELMSCQNDNESKQRMVNILKRLHEQELEDNILEEDDEESHTQLDSDDDEAAPELEERLRNVNLDNPDELWSALTESERQEFQALVISGQVENVVPEWTPWWAHGTKKVMILEVDKDGKNAENLQHCCPPIVDVPEFKDVAKAAPAVPFNLMNVIYAYAYVALYFNGEYMDCAREATHVFLSICANMSENKVFDDIPSAEESVVYEITKSTTLPKDDKIFTALKNAGDAILNGSKDNIKTLYLSAALSELHRLLTAAKDLRSVPQNTKDFSNFATKFPQHKTVDAAILSKKKLSMCLKKIEYYLSWLQTSSIKLLT